MQKSISATFSISISLVLVLSIFSINGNIYGQQAIVNNKQNTTNTTTDKNTAEPSGQVVRDTVTQLLEGKTLPKGDFIHLYDSTPYKIVTGHVAAKLPCNSKNVSDVSVLVGEAPNFKTSNLDLISQLSTPGKLCLYHVDLISNSTTTVTDIAIKNNSTHGITFPATSTVVVGVDKIDALPPGQG
ncbi:MAG: hypothetical protein M3Z01_02475 [Thermoproteota archaeon]|nr:hypothetical protein [Thermoproteota archaeon]